MNTTQDLTGDLRVTREVFCEWLASGTEQPGSGRAGATAFMLYALDQQGVDLRVAVPAETAWANLQSTTRPCCRHAGVACQCHRATPRLLGCRRPFAGGMRDAMYTGMLPDLREGEKSVQTESDELLMKTRWANQIVHH